MRALAEVESVRELIGRGARDLEIARVTGIPRTTVRDWRARCAFRSSSDARRNECPICGRGELEPSSYAYLLGLYLGDGCLSRQPRNGVYKLRITLDARYPGILNECADAIVAVRRRGRSFQVARKGCREVGSYWNHWPCLFPQHGRGVKHSRPIQLVAWQSEITRTLPGRFLRGLVHSDGCRVINQVVIRGRRYAYPRYQFRNTSSDIRAIFCEACYDFGVHWTQSGPTTISVSRACDVARLDTAVGPKQ